MPLYEYYCPTCSAKFDKLRPITAAVETATCSAGHAGAQRVISVLARQSRGGVETMEAPGAGGCCGGGGCACGR